MSQASTALEGMLKAGAEKDALAGLALLRKDFPAHQISKLPKPTKAQTEEVKANYKAGTRCKVCGTWHHPGVVHLDYVGHAALTDRLLDCDPMWNWEPLASDGMGLPTIDPQGGLWIKLTVCGVTRLGYGHAEGPRGGNTTKELIGDALRNAAMRFGAALDLWHKGDLHLEDDLAPAPRTGKETAPEAPAPDIDGDGNFVVAWSHDDVANIQSIADKMYDLLLVIGFNEDAADQKCRDYLALRNQVAVDTVANRMLNALKTIEAKAKKKLAEAEG